MRERERERERDHRPRQVQAVCAFESNRPRVAWSIDASLSFITASTAQPADLAVTHALLSQGREGTTMPAHMLPERAPCEAYLGVGKEGTADAGPAQNCDCSTSADDAQAARIKTTPNSSGQCKGKGNYSEIKRSLGC